MQLELAHPTGAEEWYCPICGRRILIQWPPAYRKVVLAAGDQYAQHSASKGGLRIGSAEIRNGEASEAVEESRLEPWREWLESVDFEDWWRRDSADVE